MTPFRRGQMHYVYVPLESGGVKERSTGARTMAMARKIDRMVKDLAEHHRWPLLRAVADKRLSLRRLYAAFVTDPSLASLETDLATPDIVPLIDAFLQDRDRMLGERASGPRTEYTLAIKYFTGDTCPASRLTPEWIDARVATLPSDWSSTYRRDVLLRLSSFCKFLVRRRVLKTNPVRDVEKPQRSQPPLVYESREKDQEICEKAPRAAYRALFALIHGSGADVSPALVMKKKDLNLGHADGWGRAHVPGTKTAKRDRHEVRIEPWATEILRDYVRHMLPGAPLFEGITRYMAAWHHRATAKDAGVPTYTLRHSRHSWAVRARQERNETWESIGAQLGCSAYVASMVYAAFKPREMIVQQPQTERA